MTFSQQLVICWMEFALTGTILLGVITIVVGRLRQPIDRVNLIFMSIAASVFVPLLFSLISTPSFRVGLFSAGENQLARVDAPIPSSHSERLSEDTGTSTVRIEQHTKADTREAVEADTPNQPAAFSENAEMRATTFPERSVRDVTSRTTSKAHVWSIIAAILLATHGTALSWFLLQWIIGTVRLRSISNNALAADQSLSTSWEEVTNSRDGSVRLLVSKEISTPMVFGWLQPVILFPISIAAGDQSSLRYCLAHEWSHVKCRDLPKWQIINLCQLALWYQPLFWILRRELRICQDLVADDQATGTAADQFARIKYSELLLSIAKGATNPGIAGGMAFCDGSSQLTRRIKMLLSKRQSLRNRSTNKFCWLSGCFLLIFSMLISSVRLSAIQAQDSGADIVAAANTGVHGATAETGKQVAKEGNAKIVRGQVVNAAGKPVANAKLWLPLQWNPRHTVAATTDESGKFELNCPDDWINPNRTGSFWTVWVYAPGYSIQSQSVYDVVRGNANEEYTIQVPPESNTRFRIMTPDGQPLIGVRVMPQNYKTTVGYEAVPKEMLTSLLARTNASGLVTLPAIQSGPLFSIEMQHEDFGRQIIRVDNNKADANRDIRLRPVASLKGRLTSENIEWVRSVPLVFTTDNQDEWKEPQGLAEVVTDDEGHFQLPIIACGGPLRTYVGIDPTLPVRPLLSESVFLTAGETVELEIPLVDAPVVRGKVVAKSTSMPVANAEISLRYGGFRQSDQVKTDENGEYEGRVLPGGVRVHIISLPDGFVQLGAPGAEPYQVPDNVDSFELPPIEVVGSHEVKGSLIGADDQPLPNIQLLAIEGNRSYGFGVSDAEGRFTMRVPDGVDTQIAVYLENRGPAPVEVIRKDPLVVKYVADDRDREMETKRALMPDVTLSGRILMAGKPIAEVPVVLKRGVPVSLGSREQMGTRYIECSESKTDANGNYRLGGLKAGDKYQIEINPPFLAADPKWQHQSPFIQNLPDSAKGEVVLPDVKLLKLTQSIAGIVIDPEGNPVKGASITVQLRSGEDLARLTRSGPPPWTESDHQGRFQLKELPDEPLSIMAYFANPKGGRIRFPARLNVEVNQQDIRIVLDPSLRDEEER